MSFPDINTPVFKYFEKNTPNWVKIGKYVNWLFKEHVPGAPGISGTFALKIHAGVKKSSLSADFWCAPLGQGYCVSITGSKETDVWNRSVKYLEELRVKALKQPKRRRK